MTPFDGADPPSRVCATALSRSRSAKVTRSGCGPDRLAAAACVGEARSGYRHQWRWCPLATSGPEFERPDAESDDGFFARLRRLFGVGPFAWVTKSLPMVPRFRAGSHMHGLEHHDIVEGDVSPRRRETDAGEEQGKRSADLRR